MEVDTANNLDLKKASNLSDLANTTTSRTNLNVYSKLEVDTANNLDLKKASNLSDVQSLATTKINLQINNVANIFNNFSAVGVPVATNDSSQGYSISSRWIFGNLEYVCTSAAVASAVWIETTKDTGEVNTASNVGFANGDVFKDKVLSNLRFRRMASLGSVMISTATDTVDFAVTTASIGLSNAINTKHNFNSIVSPQPTDDFSAGYSVGSQWINNTLMVAFICVNSSNFAALWDRLEYTFSNVGTGTGVFKQLTTLNGAEYKTILGTTNQIIATSNANDVTFSTPQNIDSSASVNFQNLTVSQAGGNGINLTGSSGVIKMTGVNTSIDNTGINGSMDRVNILNCRQFYYNNLNVAGMNIATDAVSKTINISNVSGTSENIYIHVPLNGQLFPFSAVQNFRTDMSFAKIQCVWQINGTPVVSALRFGIMGSVIFENYGPEVTATSNSIGIYTAGTNKNTITFEFTNGGFLAHQNNNITPLQTFGAPYTTNFVAGDLIIVQSEVTNPPCIWCHVYSVSGTTATWRSSNLFPYRSASLIGGDVFTAGYPFCNHRAIGSNCNLVGQRWLKSNILTYNHTGNSGAYTDTNVVSYYY